MKQPNYYDSAGTLAKKGYPRVSSILDVRHKRELGEWKVCIAEEFGAAEIQHISKTATDMGTLVHEAIETYLNTGDEVVLPADYTVTIAGREVVKSPQTLFEGFKRWYDKFKPTHCYCEVRLRSDEHRYAGRTDLVCRVMDENEKPVWWLIDFKTSKRLDPGMGLQLAAYRQAYFENTGIEPRTAILQLTTDIKRGYRWKEYEGDFNVFLAHKTIWEWLEAQKKPVEESTWDGKTLKLAEAVV